MIKIRQQDAQHQYDEDDRIITTWDSKKCSWIIESHYEHEQIDWYGKNNDFPSGETLAKFIERNPDWDKLPDISVTWTWNTAERMQSAFGRPSTIDEMRWYANKPFPCSDVRNWGYLNYTKEEAIERLGKYCDFNKGADNTKVVYNGEIIFNGNLI